MTGLGGGGGGGGCGGCGGDGDGISSGGSTSSPSSEYTVIISDPRTTSYCRFLTLRLFFNLSSTIFFILEINDNIYVYIILCLYMLLRAKCAFLAIGHIQKSVGVFVRIIYGAYHRSDRIYFIIDKHKKGLFCGKMNTLSDNLLKLK